MGIESTEAQLCRSCGQACGHTVTIYDRKIYRTMVVLLRYLVFNEFVGPGGPYAHQGDVLMQTGMAGKDCMGKLAIWGLAEDDPEANGFWRATEKGLDFIEGKIRVPLGLYVAGDNNAVRGESCSLQVSASEILDPYDGPRRRHEANKLRSK